MKALFSTILFVCVFISQTLFAQTIYYTQYKNGEYEKIEKKLINALNSEPTNVVYNHVMGKVFATQSYENYNLKKAYKHFYTAIRYFDRLPNYDVERLARSIPLTAEIIGQDFIAVCDSLLAQAKKKGTIEALNEFINDYKNSPKVVMNKALEERNTKAFAIAEKENTVESYDLFKNTYPFAKQAKEAEKRRDKMAYDIALKINTVEAYQSYIAKYPGSVYREEADFNAVKMLFAENTKTGSFESYKQYVAANPKSKMAAFAIEKMVEIAKADKNVKQLRTTVELSKGIHLGYALFHYYLELTNDGEFITLYNFYNEFRGNPFEQRVVNDLKIAELGEGLDLHMGYDSSKVMKYGEYIELAAPKEKAFVALQRLIYPSLKAQKWSEALRTVAHYGKYFGENDERIKSLKRILAKPYDQTVVVTKLSEKVNTKQGGEYSPIISADNKWLYFCGKLRKGCVGGEDIFVSKNINGQWQEAFPISELSDPTTNDAVLSISADGTTMIYFVGGIIYVSQKTSSGWSVGYPISDEINSARWNADAMISSDGNALIFASIRPQNYNYYTKPKAGSYHGANLHQSDIYVSLKTENGWGKPQNLGLVINTKYTDRSPYLHPDMKTLYFSSDGHGGLGNMDVFMSKRLSDTCWDCWSKPVNLGKEINTTEDNWGYRISTDGNVAYFAANDAQTLQHDIFTSTLPLDMRPQKVTTITGKLVNSEGKPISATISWEDLSTGEVIGTSKSDPVDGSYFIVLPQGKMYGYFIDDKKYYPESSSIDLLSKNQQKEISNDIQVVPIANLRSGGAIVRLNNLFFNSGKSELLPYSIPELKRVARIIIKSNAAVEISGHTDNVGDDIANQKLSLARASAVRDFLIKQGAQPNLLVVKGYGEAKPVETNETSQGRAKNRRVEMRFL